MPGLGIWEIVFILVLALLIFGPKKLPEIGRTLGRGLGEFKRASSDLKRSFDLEVRDLEREEENRIAPPASTVARPMEAPLGEAADGESTMEPVPATESATGPAGDPLAESIAAEPPPDAVADASADDTAEQDGSPGGADGTDSPFHRPTNPDGA